MPLRFDQPEYLWLALLSVPFVWIGWRWFGAMTRMRKAVAIVARVALLALLVFMLAGLCVVRKSDTLAVVAVVDISGSVRRFYQGGHDAAMEAVRQFLRGAEARRGPDDLLGMVVFDGKAATVATPTRGVVSERDIDLHMAEGTDIGGAIRLARAMIPPDAAGRIVLFSDGNQTKGDAVVAAAQAGTAAGGLAVLGVDVVALNYALAQEVIVEQVDAPPAAQSGATIMVRVLLNATSATEGTLKLVADGREVELARSASGRRVTLHAGQNVEQVSVQLDDRRVHRFTAVFEPDTELDERGMPRLVGDTVTENNSGSAFTLSPGRGTVLLAQGSGAAQRGASMALAEALRGSGFSVEVTRADELPRTVLAFQEHDLVILQDAAADAVDESTQVALTAYVQDLGGGLVFVGGPESFGAGGWKGSKLEPLMPVLLDLPERLVTPEVAIVFVLDNSGSMWRTVLGSDKTQQEIANDAAALAIRSLDSRDMVGVITFNSEAEVLVPLGKNGTPAETIRAVRGISSGGGTNAVPALKLAGDALAGVDAKVKHIVLLSDGRSKGAEMLPGMCQELSAQGIRVTTIAVGDDADLAVMQQMAREGGGAYHHALNPMTLPQVLLKAVRVVRTPMIREEPFEPVVLSSGSPMIAGLGAIPTLGGLALTQPRQDALVSNVLGTAKGEPVLASWQAGLGQVVAYTSDAAEWAGEWIGKPSFQRFWAQVVRAASRSSAASPGLTGVISEREGNIHLRLDASTPEGKPLDSLAVKASLYAPSGSSTEVVLSQVGPGAYEGSVAASEVGSYVAIFKPTAPERRLIPVVAGTTVVEGPEFRSLTSNPELLRTVARVSGGRELELSDGAKLFDRTGVTAREAMIPLRDVLLWWTLAAALVDIATRRVAWDRWFSAMFRGAAARARVETAASTLGALRSKVASPAREDVSLALGKAEADQLVAQARDRRRAQRLAGLQEQWDPQLKPAKTEEPREEEGGLLAAKRRAQRRFEEGDGGAD